MAPTSTVPTARGDVPPAPGDLLADLDAIGVVPGARATLVQFSSTFCAPCRATRRVLERVVATSDGVAHVELDVADRTELAERWDVAVTPTVLVLDGDGVLLRRAEGVPTLAQVRAVLAEVPSGSA